MKGLEKINNLDSTYYLEDNEIIWGSIEEYLENKQEEYEGIKDNIEIWEEEQLEKLEKYTGREIVQNIINTLKEENDYLFHRAYDLDQEMEEMSYIKAYIDYDNETKTHYYKDFKIVDRLPEIEEEFIFH